MGTTEKKNEMKFIILTIFELAFATLNYEISDYSAFGILNYSEESKVISVCEHRQFAKTEFERGHVTCEENNKINIVSAIYGRPIENQICTEQVNQSCLAEKDLTVFAKSACNGKNSCIFRGRNGMVGDPCPNIEKYTTITYTCIEGSKDLEGSTDSICESCETTGYTMELGRDYTFNDIKMFGGRFDHGQCAALCDANKDCQLFTVGGNACYLKYRQSIGRKVRDNILQASSGRKCDFVPECSTGPKANLVHDKCSSCSSTGFTTEFHVDYSGWDIQAFRNEAPLNHYFTVDECARLCDRNPACEFFRLGAHNCYLKAKAGQARKKDHGVSGRKCSTLPECFRRPKINVVS